MPRLAAGTNRFGDRMGGADPSTPAPLFRRCATIELGHGRFEHHRRVRTGYDLGLAREWIAWREESNAAVQSGWRSQDPPGQSVRQ